MISSFSAFPPDRCRTPPRELGLAHILDLCDEQWGQRHFMVRDPNGLAIDVVQYIGPPPT